VTREKRAVKGLSKVSVNRARVEVRNARIKGIAMKMVQAGEGEHPLDQAFAAAMVMRALFDCLAVGYEGSAAKGAKVVIDCAFKGVLLPVTPRKRYVVSKGVKG
jgi:hypothetical protein